MTEDGGKPVAHGEAQIAGGRSPGQNGNFTQKLRPVVHAPGAQLFALLDGGGEGIGQVGFDTDKGEVGVVGQEAGNRFPADGDHLVGAAAEGEGGAVAGVAGAADGDDRIGSDHPIDRGFGALVEGFVVRFAEGGVAEAAAGGDEGGAEAGAAAEIGEVFPAVGAGGAELASGVEQQVGGIEHARLAFFGGGEGGEGGVGQFEQLGNLRKGKEKAGGVARGGMGFGIVEPVGIPKPGVLHSELGGAGVHPLDEGRPVAHAFGQDIGGFIGALDQNEAAELLHREGLPLCKLHGRKVFHIVAKAGFHRNARGSAQRFPGQKRRHQLGGEGDGNLGLALLFQKNLPGIQRDQQSGAGRNGGRAGGGDGGGRKTEQSQRAQKRKKLFHRATSFFLLLYHARQSLARKKPKRRPQAPFIPHFLFFFLP